MAAGHDVAGRDGMRERINTIRSPRAVGPYSQGVKAAGFLFTSGVLPLDPVSGELVPGGIESETRKSIENLREVLVAAGLSLADVIKTTVFLTDMEDFPTMNRIYAEFFGEILPARSTVEVGGLARGARVEIEAVAVA